MASRDSFAQECDYYGSKCQQHLARTKLCHDLAIEAVGYHRSETSGSAVSTGVAELIQKFVDDADSELSDRLVLALRETHFLALKVNFEFFLYRLVTCNWAYRFEKIANSKTGRWRKNEVQLVDLAKSAPLGCDAREFVIERAVVSQGLYGHPGIMVIRRGDKSPMYGMMEHFNDQ